MSESYIQQLFAERIGGERYGKSTEIYKFEKIKRAKRAALEAYPDRALLDFGIGENDDMADERVRTRMKREVDKLENRGYADNGIPEYKQAASAFMKREFGVELDPVLEVNHALGNKSALALLPAAFINPGDITLMTVPGYPVAGTWAKYLGGEVYNLPLTSTNSFLPDLESIPEDVAKRAKLLVINYPNSPTGALATTDFYERVVAFAKKNGVVVIQDATHAMLSFAAEPSSFLQVDGAKDVGVELHSMSKGFDMIGWRLGFVAGNPLVVKAFADVKDNADSGQFIAIQKASSLALAEPEIPRRVREKYKRRLLKLVEVLNSHGFRCEMPGGTFFLYTPSPKKAGQQSFSRAEDASQFLIREMSICTVPWDDAGPFLRFAVTYQAEDEAAEDALMQDLSNRLGSYEFAF